MEKENHHDFFAWGNWLLPVALIAGLIFLLQVDDGLLIGRTAHPSPIEGNLRQIVAYFVSAAEAGAALVIGVGMVFTIYIYLKNMFLRPSSRLDFIKNIQIGFGRTLALGLEFTIASDILRTAIAPSRQEIMNLAAVVILRTLLNYFLEREIEQMERTCEVD